MTNVIHFHAPTHINIGDAAVVCSIRDLLNKYLKISSYKLMNIEKLKGFTWNLQASLTRLRSPKAINTYDLCIIGGGGLYSHFFFPINNELIKSIKIPIILYGIGNNLDFGDNELSKAQKNSIYLLNKHSRLSSVRDTETYKFLRNLNIQNVNIIGDPAIFLETKKGDKIISCRNKMRIGINIAHHKWKLQSLYLNKVINAYVEACNFFVRELDAQIIYLKHTPREDVLIRELEKSLPIRVVDYCPSRNLTYRLHHRLPILPFKIGECRPHELKYVYSNLDLVIGMHLHSAILAFSSGVPIINIAYNLKNYSFMKFIHQEDKIIRVDRIDSKRLKKVSICALDNSSEIKRNFEHLKNNMWENHEKFLKIIQSL